MLSLPEFSPADCSLPELLKAQAVSGSGKLICYPAGNTSTPKEFSYNALYTLSSRYSTVLRGLPGFEERKPILIHLDDAWESIVWFWAVMLANGLPVLSSPFSNVEEHRYRHVEGLSDLLEFPICITSQRLLQLFDKVEGFLKLHTIESLCHEDAVIDQHGPLHQNEHLNPHIGSEYVQASYEKGHALAMLMLTSGSTGNAKAVRLSHKQVFAAIAGKASVRPLGKRTAFLNWVGLDHVASLVEIHIQALWLGVDQVHVSAADVVSSPTVFLDLLSRHRVCRTFAPNFFLGRLVSVTKAADDNTIDESTAWDLSSLRIVASGGEANDVRTCEAAAALFEKFGACENVITPGFGMTETCAGAIFNLACPDHDLKSQNAVASLGTCMKGIEMRIVTDSNVVDSDVPGDLEIRGDVVFDGYYRNADATALAFPLGDGWFRTGDQGYIDTNGNLSLIGRTKDVININGIKIVTADIDVLLEQGLRDKVNRFVVFPSRTAHTEQITIAYIPSRWPHLDEDMAEIDDLVCKLCLAGTSARPLVFSLLETSVPRLPSTTLGKISRAKMSALFAQGVFEEDVTSHEKTLTEYRNECRRREASSQVATETEKLLMADFAATLGIDDDLLGPETQVFELGFTSMDLIRLKRRIDTRLHISVPVIELIKNPTAKLLAKVLEGYTVSDADVESPEHTVSEYDPVVVLKSTGSKSPLWLVHPGVGEVLVFVGLAQHLADDDRPVYALRARGFEPGHKHFDSIEDTVDTYVHAIQQRQPYGPYALAGYSYGAMLAFEISKRLNESTLLGESDETPVRFLGSFNLPPHIKSRMRQLRWNLCLLHLAQFLGLVSEDEVEIMEEQPGFVMLSREEALIRVLRIADANRLEELGLEDAALSRWVNVAYGLQSMAVEYEPSGRVAGIDVFHAVPLKQAASSREEWIGEHLSKWRDFSRTEPQFHAVGGAHYTMIGPEHVTGFASKLKLALEARGV